MQIVWKLTKGNKKRGIGKGWEHDQVPSKVWKDPTPNGHIIFRLLTFIV